MSSRATRFPAANCWTSSGRSSRAQTPPGPRRGLHRAAARPGRESHRSLAGARPRLRRRRLGRPLPLGGSGGQVDRARPPRLAGGEDSETQRRRVRDVRRGHDSLPRRELRSRLLQAGARARPPPGGTAGRGPPGPGPRRLLRRFDLAARALPLAESLELHAGGLCNLLRAAGLEPVELRPGIDGMALISVRLFGSSPPRWLRRQFDRWWAARSPLNALIDGYARLAGLDPQATIATKLVLCGAFTFLARRPDGEGA